MNRRMLLLAGLMLVGMGSAVAWADSMGRGPMMGAGRMFGDRGAMMLPLLLKHANLTPEQSQQVQKIMQADREGLRSAWKQLEGANNQLADKLFASGKAQIEDLTPLVQRITQLRQQLMEQGLKTALAVRGVLTADQLAKMAQVKDRMQKLHAEMRSLFEGTD